MLDDYDPAADTDPQSDGNRHFTLAECVEFIRMAGPLRDARVAEIEALVDLLIVDSREKLPNAPEAAHRAYATAMVRLALSRAGPGWRGDRSSRLAIVGGSEWE